MMRKSKIDGGFERFKKIGEGRRSEKLSVDEKELASKTGSAGIVHLIGAISI